MVGKNTSSHETNFTVSIDLIGFGCTTGISASDRSKTVLRLIDEQAKPSDFGRPGHIFPLKAKKGGVLRRAGHTEAAIDLARLAGFEPAGLIVEIMTEDGEMARVPDLVNIAKQHDLKFITIKDLIAYRLSKESLVTEEIEVNMPTNFGDFSLKAFTQINTGVQHIVLKKGEWKDDEPVMVRVHSSCITGDIF
jgi:3,4-dihydroxy 2-butanone 4-phosphate synthase / GTP cyclohydrolase II